LIVTRHWTTLALFALLVIVQAQLWFGPGGRPHVVGLESQVAMQRASNASALSRNDRLAAEVADLKSGLAMVEEKARMELGMIKAQEIFVQVMPAAK
jgi:cell division protein FtsB